MRTVKRICALLLALMLLSLTALTAAADDTTITLYGFSFTINGEGKATIFGYDGRSDTVVIPNKLLGADVIEIADYAFYGLDAITSLSFEDAASLIVIGTSAFTGCSGVTSLTLTDTVTQLGFGAFQNCTGLETLVIGEGITALPTQCFFDCTALEDVTLPDTLTTIGERAFAHCTALRTLAIPDQVTAIADNAFDGCDDLMILCAHDSYACAWAVENNVRYSYSDGDIRGDADADGEISILDATAIQRHLASYIVSSFNEENADADADGEISIIDATAVQRYLVGLQTAPSVGEFLPYRGDGTPVPDGDPASADPGETA